MSEYNHEDKKEYLIAEGKYWRIWNNGIVERLPPRWKKIAYLAWEPDIAGELYKLERVFEPVSDLSQLIEEINAYAQSRYNS